MINLSERARPSSASGGPCCAWSQWKVPATCWRGRLLKPLIYGDVPTNGAAIELSRAEVKESIGPRDAFPSPGSLSFSLIQFQLDPHRIRRKGREDEREREEKRRSPPSAGHDGQWPHAKNRNNIVACSDALTWPRFFVAGIGGCSQFEHPRGERYAGFQRYSNFKSAGREDNEGRKDYETREP